jgi:XisI protein
MARLSHSELAEITRREVKWYAGVSDDSTAYFFEDDKSNAYAVNIINDELGKNHSMIMMQARVVDDCVIIDEDKVWDKQLWKALEKAGVPREQIILAYKGEKVPEASETT